MELSIRNLSLDAIDYPTNKDKNKGENQNEDYPMIKENQTPGEIRWGKKKKQPKEPEDEPILKGDAGEGYELKMSGLKIL